MEDRDAFIAALRGPILVTGASGFVGTNLFKMIARVRNDVFAVVQRDKGWRLADVPDEQTIAVDLNNQAAMKNLVDTSAPQTVFHCAAYGAYSFEQDSDLILQTNFLATVKLIEMLQRSGVSAFVHAGSSSEYGTNCSGPTEDSKCEPNSPYSVSKVSISSFIEFVGKERSFPGVNLRLYSVYGPLEDTSRLIPTLVQRCSVGELPPLVEPRTSRDFVYIDDVCDAFILAAAKMNPGLYGESLNIGSGTMTTIADLVDIARSTFDVRAEPVFNSMSGRQWDLPDWYANPAKAAATIDWRATTPLETGLRLTGVWLSELSADDVARATKAGKSERPRSVSAIIACYRDAEAIPYMHQRLTDTFRKLGIDYEIIFVNDGSPDDSAEVIRAISARDPRVLGITHSRNFGSQMAFRSGMELSTKDAVVLLDGDLQDPPELIEDFYSKMDEGFDVVYGRRVKREMSWLQGLFYKFFYRIFARVSYISIPLDAGDFSLMDRRVVLWLLNSPERDLFLRGLRAYVGFRQTGIDYVRPERMFGRTTNNLIKNVDWAKKAIFSFSNSPMTMLTNTGIVMLILSGIAAVIIATLRIFVPEIAPQGATSVLIGILFFGAVNLFAIGLVGEYVAKILIEVKERPRLIRSALIKDGQSNELLPDGKAVIQ